MPSSVSLRRAGFAAVAVASVLLLAACAPGTGPADDYPGLPVSEHEEEGGHEEPGHEEGEPAATWVGQGGQLAVTLWGSSSCPPVGREIRVIEPAGKGNTVAIDLVERPEDEVCTMDLAPHTTVFWTPLDVTTTEPLKVEVAGSTVTVPVK